MIKVLSPLVHLGLVIVQEILFEHVFVACSAHTAEVAEHDRLAAVFAVFVRDELERASAILGSVAVTSRHPLEHVVHDGPLVGHGTKMIARAPLRSFPAREAQPTPSCAGGALSLAAACTESELLVLTRAAADPCFLAAHADGSIVALYRPSRCGRRRSWLVAKGLHGRGRTIRGGGRRHSYALHLFGVNPLSLAVLLR